MSVSCGVSVSHVAMGIALTAGPEPFWFLKMLVPAFQSQESHEISVFSPPVDIHDFKASPHSTCNPSRKLQGLELHVHHAKPCFPETGGPSRPKLDVEILGSRIL